LLSLLTISGTLFAADNDIIFAEQNWTDRERNYFYYADQGSRLIAYDLFINLEAADNDQLLKSDDNMRRFGFIPQPSSTHNPDALPIGITRNGDKMGLTCAACHTQQINYHDKTLRIDGGQAFVDVQLFLTGVTNSLHATLEDKQKFARFQQSLLGSKASLEQQNELRQRLTQAYAKRAQYAINNHTDLAYGYTRLDAFGSILNVALVATGVAHNTNPPDAPTSYPYIWDTPQHDYVEWNGSQSNSSVGALARNLGEVIGVFGDITTEPTSFLGFMDTGYKSSIQAAELRKLESLVAKLYSPTWPHIFPKIDTELAKLGRGLYEQHCIQCHVDINRTDPKRQIKVRMSTLAEINTDPLMARNAILSTGKTGKFEGLPRYYFAGDPLPEQAPAIHIANNIMIGVLKNNPLQAWLAKRDAKALGHPDTNHPPKYVDGKIIEKGQEASNHALLAYKARPLNGVWTSAPYLHNGSVPDMYQLLLPANERSKQFSMGSVQYDPQTLGYINGPSDSSFMFDTTLPGNSNSGHEYGTGYYDKPALTEPERWALIEYLKTL
jgi:hypothetical protein